MARRPDLLDRTAAAGARDVALALLDEAEAAAGRLEARSDPEALHDFRVGLRRLRSALRAFRPWLGEAMGDKLEAQLRELSHATGAARDAEVHLAWVDATRATARQGERAALDALAAGLTARAAQGAAPDAIVARHRRLAARVRTRLERAAAATPTTSFGAALATLATEHLDALRRRLARVEAARDERPIHRARIAGKRLRYLLEPLRGDRHADARKAVKRLKRLQELLGELHDAHVLGHEVRRTLRHVRHADRAAIGAVERRVAARRDGLFAELQARRAAGAVDALAAEVHALAATLAAHAAGARPATRRAR